MKLVWRQRAPRWLSQAVLSCKAQPSQTYAARQVIPPLVTHIPADSVLILRPKHQLMTCMIALTALVPFQVNGQKGTLAARAIEANRHKCSVSAAALGMCARCRHKQPMSCNSWNCPACLRDRSEMGLFEEHGRSSRSIPRV